MSVFFSKPELCEGIILSKSVKFNLVFGEYAAPMMTVGVVYSRMVRISMLGELGCGTSSTGMPPWVTIINPPLGFLWIGAEQPCLWII